MIDILERRGLGDDEYEKKAMRTFNPEMANYPPAEEEEVSEPVSKVIKKYLSEAEVNDKSRDEYAEF